MIYRTRELKSVFIEMMQKGFKNIYAGWIYRYPRIQHSKFNHEYLKFLSEKLIDETKEVILIGDYNNIDLPKCDLKKMFLIFLTS